MASINEIASRTYKRTPATDLSAFKNDIKTFNILMAMDGTRSVATIAREDLYDIEDLVEKVNQLASLGLLESSHGGGGGGTNLDPSFIKALQSELTKIVGPVAGALINKSVSEMGCDMATFPAGRVGELLEVLSNFIQDHSESVMFKQRMLARIGR